MPTTRVTNKLIPVSNPVLLIVFAALGIVSFFLPWVLWDQTPVTGSAIASGEFFKISETGFGLANPFPQFSFAMYGLWLIPALAVLTIVLALLKKKMPFVPVMTGILLLSIVTMYILFSQSLKDLGIIYQVQLGIYFAILAGIGLIISGVYARVAKLGLLLIGPLVTFAAFHFATKQVEGQVYENPADLKPAFEVSASDLISSFKSSDSLANAKYREQIITVNGNISAVEVSADSTSNIKFSDSTGSYVIFPFDKAAMDDIKKLKEGDPVSVKGSCSGGVYSDILETEVITFKRCVLIKK